MMQPFEGLTKEDIINHLAVIQVYIDYRNWVYRNNDAADIPADSHTVDLRELHSQLWAELRKKNS